MSAREQLVQGRRVLAEHGIDADAQVECARLVYGDGLDPAAAQIVAANEAHMWASAPLPHTPERVARHICERSGAFPWEGPIGNGLSVGEYRDRLRGVAVEHLFAWRLLGLDTETDQEAV